MNGGRITRETKGGLGVQRHFVFLYLSFFSPVSFLTLTYVNFLPASITRLLRNRFLYLQVQWEILEKPYRSGLS